MASGHNGKKARELDRVGAKGELVKLLNIHGLSGAGRGIPVRLPVPPLRPIAREPYQYCAAGVPFRKAHTIVVAL